MVAQTGVASAGVAGHGGHRGTLYVSRDAKPYQADRSCRSAAFRTIQSAVTAAHAGDTVVVCPGSYHEQVVIKKPVSLDGLHAAINQQGVTPSLVVNVPHVGKLPIFAGVVILSSHVSVQGFLVTNALGEGILAAGYAATSATSASGTTRCCTTTWAVACHPPRATSSARRRARTR